MSTTKVKVNYMPKVRFHLVFECSVQLVMLEDLTNYPVVQVSSAWNFTSRQLQYWIVYWPVIMIDQGWLHSTAVECRS